MVICSRAAGGSSKPVSQARASAPSSQLRGRHAVVIEHRLDALLPLAALLDERVAQPDPRAQVEQVLGRDPRFRQPADHQQLTQVARVGAIALGALLGPATRGGLGRLGQMHPRADRP